MKEVKDVKSYKKLEIIALSGEGLTDAESQKTKIQTLNLLEMLENASVYLA